MRKEEPSLLAMSRESAVLTAAIGVMAEYILRRATVSDPAARLLAEMLPDIQAVCRKKMEQLKQMEAAYTPVPEDSPEDSDEDSLDSAEDAIILHTPMAPEAMAPEAMVPEVSQTGADPEVSHHADHASEHTDHIEYGLKELTPEKLIELTGDSPDHDSGHDIAADRD